MKQRGRAVRTPQAQPSTDKVGACVGFFFFEYHIIYIIPIDTINAYVLTGSNE